MRNVSNTPNRQLLSKNKYLAFIDILGFKSLLENNSIEEVFEYYTSFCDDLQLENSLN